MPVIGVTGAVGAGKSTVVRCFARHGATVIDADAIGHALLRPGGPCFDALRARFGEEIVGPDGTIVRAALGARAFATPADTAALNAITHPALVAELRRQVQAADRPGRAVVIDAALLLEWGSPVPLDRTVVVTAPEPERVRRMAERTGLPDEQIRQRAARQMSEDEKARHADYVIPNDDTLASFEARAELLWQRLRDELHLDDVPATEG